MFKKKNLFKVGNEGGGVGAGGIASTDQSRHMAQRESPYLLHQQHPHGLTYSHIPLAPHHHQYSSQIQAQNFIPTHKLLGGGNYDFSALSSAASESVVVPMMQVKQLMATNTRDCESGGSEQNNTTSLPTYHQACESGLEVGTCDQASHHQSMVTSRDDQNLNEWGVIDRLVTSDQLGNDQVQDANPSSMNHINQLSLRSGMDFWGYGK